jgi:hypothetical protein
MNTDEYYEKHYAPIVGGTIVAILTDEDEEDTYVGLSIVASNGKAYALWCLSDAEGNGAGHLDMVEASCLLK